MTNRVMIVDDEPGVRRVVRRILEPEEFEVLEASDGPEALEKLEGDSELDLVLIDIFMPEMDGRELVMEIRSREELEDLNLAILSVASNREMKKKKMRDAGVLDFIQKPFDKDELIRRVKEIV